MADCVHGYLHLSKIHVYYTKLYPYTINIVTCRIGGCLVVKALDYSPESRGFETR
jgi:hypothetical protein